ncbi:hypothetical protein LTR85_001019 [Meristemomyces frigidus]|nr:hypothetical protein LTR85_001019 [Meristemomyces frigidus]
MRLLKRNDTGGVTFTKDLSHVELSRFNYAILSHTWGSEEEEVIYEDALTGEGTSKPGSGSEKIRFCIQQTVQDGLEYFWVDTCCINKKDDAELSKSLRSMFRWYAGANRCYAFLTDVPQGDVLGTEWMHTFRLSRWFRRGWTLQELIAPSALEFYSRNGKRLGSKATLKLQIAEITGIPVKALSGRDLANFTMQERRQWQEGRQTREPEDLVHSLLGLLDISVPVLYGEGVVKAQQRLDNEISTAQKGPRHRDFSIPFGDRKMKGVEKLVGKKGELESMHVALIGNRTRRSIVILSGLGGIGKTQLAVAYAKQHQDSYSAVFRLNIRDEKSVKLSFAVVAERILRYHPSTRHVSFADLTGNLDEIVAAVLAWLSDSEDRRWLVIYDNYDNPKVPGNDARDAVDILRFLPDAYQGSVIITARSAQVKHGRKIPVRKLTSAQDSVDILSNVSGRALSMKGLKSPKPEAAGSFHEIGRLYSNQGRMEEAEEMYLRALRGKEEAWGPKHRSTLDTVNNLGILYADQGRIKEAEAMYTRALEGYQNVEGNHEADVEYLQEQLEALKMGGRVSNSHVKGELQSQPDRDLADLAGQSDRTARMRDFASHILNRP